MAGMTDQRDEEARAGRDTRRPATRRETLGVLVVDDDDLFRRAIRTLLETDRRLNVIGEAADGQEALDATIELSPDVVLMDLDMPGMGGLEAITQLARHKAGPPVIVLTGSNDPRAIERAHAAGAARYLLKSHIADVCGLVVAVGRREPD
jgi:DNA-binding NarL/FixJ family response regulator